MKRKTRVYKCRHCDVGPFPNSKERAVHEQAEHGIQKQKKNGNGGAHFCPICGTNIDHVNMGLKIASKIK